MTKTSTRRLTFPALGLAVALTAGLGCGGGNQRGASHDGRRTGAAVCSVTSSDLSTDLNFKLECPPMGEQGWGWCSHGCSAHLAVAYNIVSQPSRGGSSGQWTVPGKCDQPTGTVTTCRFDRATAGKALGEKRIHAPSDQPFAWTNIMGQRKVDIELSDPRAPGRRFSFPLDSTHAEETVVAVDRVIADWKVADASAQETAQQEKAGALAKRQAVADALTAECKNGSGESCYKVGEIMRVQFEQAQAAGASGGSPFFGQKPQAMEWYEKACKLGYQQGCQWSVHAQQNGAPDALQGGTPLHARLDSEHSFFSTPVMVGPGQSLQVTVSTSFSTASLDCELRNADNRTRFDKAISCGIHGRCPAPGQPCRLAVTNRGAFPVPAIVFIATDERDPIEVSGLVRTQ